MTLKYVDPRKCRQRQSKLQELRRKVQEMHRKLIEKR
jgi:hypothetical protein